MKTSEKIDLIAPAIVAAHKVLKNLGFDAENPHFGNEYVSLPTLLREIRPVYAEQDIALLQFPSGFCGLDTILLHKSGQWISEMATAVPAKPNDPQSVGSCITYLRRYGALAISGIAGDTDDDGNAASEPEKKKLTMNQAGFFRSKVGSIKDRVAGKYTIFDITFTNGTIAATFKQEIAALAHELMEKASVIECSVKENRFGYEILELKPAPEGETEDDDLPF